MFATGRQAPKPTTEFAPGKLAKDLPAGRSGSYQWAVPGPPLNGPVTLAVIHPP
jgi:hypothetical protein